MRQAFLVSKPHKVGVKFGENSVYLIDMGKIRIRRQNFEKTTKKLNTMNTVIERHPLIEGHYPFFSRLNNCFSFLLSRHLLNSRFQGFSMPLDVIKCEQNPSRRRPSLLIEQHLLLEHPLNRYRKSGTPKMFYYSI